MHARHGSSPLPGRVPAQGTWKQTRPQKCVRAVRKHKYLQLLQFDRRRPGSFESPPPENFLLARRSCKKGGITLPCPKFSFLLNQFIALDIHSHLRLYCFYYSSEPCHPSLLLVPAMSYYTDLNLARDEDGGDSYNNFTHGPHMNNLMSRSSAYSGLNEGHWQINDMLPQLSNTVKALSHDGSAPSASSNAFHRSSLIVMAPPPTSNLLYGAPSTMNYLPPAQALMRPVSTITPLSYTQNATDTKLGSALHLCKTCLPINQSRMRYAYAHL